MTTRKKNGDPEKRRREASRKAASSRSKPQPAAVAANGSAADGAIPADFRLDDQICFKLRRVIRIYNKIFSEQMIEALTVPQFSLLAKLWERGQCWQAEVSRLIEIDPPTVTGMIRRLGDRLVSEADRANPGRVILSLSDPGRALTQRGLGCAGRISAEMMRGLEPHERVELLRLLDKMASAHRDDPGLCEGGAPCSA